MKPVFDSFNFLEDILFNWAREIVPIFSKIAQDSFLIPSRKDVGPLGELKEVFGIV